ncbi:hypothetical protein HC891_10710 [Candidatus Gracilibacteria bacterium]|nr:hypothetical protein [Candidatus Gracilibacteria bacterium]
MRTWKPHAAFGRWIALLVLIVALGGVIVLANELLRAVLQPPEQWPIDADLYLRILGLLGLLVLSGMATYRFAGALSMRYAVDRNAVYVTWLGNRVVIPLAQIELIERGVTGKNALQFVMRSFGYYHGQMRLDDGRTLHLLTPISPARSLVIYTASDAYAIAPDDADAFMADLEQRRRLGAIQQLTPAFDSGRLFLYAFWGDPVVKATLIAAIGLNLLLLGFLMVRYPGLEPLVEMRFTAAGDVAELRPRHQVLFTPMAASVILLLNAGLGLMLYKREQVGARMLQFGSLLVQVLFSIAALSIITGMKYRKKAGRLLVSQANAFYLGS